MAAAASSPLDSSVEKTNGAKLSRLLIDGGTTVLRKVFDCHHPPANLTADLNVYKTILSNLLNKKGLRKPQWDKLFPPGGAAPDSSTFDITLLFLLLSNICGLTPPPSGWHTKPHPSDTSCEADLARVKFYRNVLYGHVTTTVVDTPTFSALWTEISGVLVRLGLNQAEVDRLKAEKGGEQDYIEVLIEWADSEEDIKSQLKNILQAQTKTHLAVEDVHQIQTKTLKTVDDMHQTQAKTQQTVEDIQHNQTKALKTVEDLFHEQTKTRQAVETLREEREKDREAEVLQKLAKSEFRGDIDYYLQKFQVGTREWVFERVQNWLDDGNSQNRVMVISGKAGMGKSVIAAVICKRMQETGRLSGSHFCQYNNVRYCKPQLMLQSLACHLSHALSKYKQALVQQLSRNLGTDPNNMGVEELFALLFKEPLSAVSDPERNMLMVIDGLDESEYQGRNELLDVIANQFCKLPIWIRFLVTTRPALNIAEKLKHLKPFELKSNDEKNLEDIRVFFLQRLGHLVKVENIPKFVERLVLKSEGLMLYAYFLILSITENTSAVHERDLHDSLPLGISSVYFSYFKRLESELSKLDIKEEHFLNMLSAITASREPLPVGFVSKLLVPSCNSPLAKRKILRALGSVSTLLPVRDDCVHVIHKSVKDWLTDTSSYGEHEFITDENEGHRILAALCTDELDYLKRKGVHDVQFSATERYALYHGTHHLLHAGVKREPHTLDKLTKAYIIDLEIVYAKTCVNSTLATEDILWLKKQGISTMLSNDHQSLLDTLSFLLRKHLRRLTDAPRTFFQIILNQGGKVLSVEASNLLQNWYPEIPYMENVHKEAKQGGVVARFQCSSGVVCLDVSPQLDYMVCQCKDGMLQLWSLHTGRLVWTRPVIARKRYMGRSCFGLPYKYVRSKDVQAYCRSVVFHPTKEFVLPGILSQVYTMDGNLKPFFPGSNCRFSVCSISGDKTKILTNSLEDSKLLVLWSLQNGLEIDRILRDKDILSFAWSGDGRLLAIAHSSGLICLFDVMHGFKELAQTFTFEECQWLRFSPDHQSLFCWPVFVQFVYGIFIDLHFYRLSVNKKTDGTFAIHVASSSSSSSSLLNYLEKFQHFNECGFLFGDHIFSSEGLIFFLDEQHFLRGNAGRIEMVAIKNVNKSGQGKPTPAFGIALRLDGQTVYVASETSVTAWDVLSGKLKGESTHSDLGSEGFLKVGMFCIPLCLTRQGVLIATSQRVIELWAHDLSECMRKWTNLPDIKQMITISEERVAVIGKSEVQVMDTSSGELVLIIPVSHGVIVTCNSKCQVLIMTLNGSLQLIDDTTVIWKWDRDAIRLSALVARKAAFSPSEQFLAVCISQRVLVLDAETGNTLSDFSLLPAFGRFPLYIHFVTDEKCVIHSALSISLFNVKSGEILSTIDVEGVVLHLEASPVNRLVAIGLGKSTPNFKVFRVQLPRGEDTAGNRKRPCRAPLRELEGYDSSHQNAVSSSSSHTGDPPALVKVLPSRADIKVPPTKLLQDADLPVDVLLLTAENCGFLACYNELKDPHRCYFDYLGYVYFSDMGDGQQTVKVALLSCYENDSGPGGSLISIKNAATILRPKAVIYVGTCKGFNPTKCKLGDVVVSAKLATYQEQSTGMRSYVSKRFLNVIKNCADGWQVPLKNPAEAQQVQVYTNGEILSGPEHVCAKWRRDQLAKAHPQAIAIETGGEGVFSAAFDCEIEWLIVKGIAGYADGSQLLSENWSSCASVMAASLVAHILSDACVFHSWPHYQGPSERH